MAITVGNLIVKNDSVETQNSVSTEETTVQNNKLLPSNKKFNKRLSAYMIDMLTTEE